MVNCAWDNRLHPVRKVGQPTDLEDLEDTIRFISYNNLKEETSLGYHCRGCDLSVMGRLWHVDFMSSA
jgi:hypothetical protein